MQSIHRGPGVAASWFSYNHPRLTSKTLSHSFLAQVLNLLLPFRLLLFSFYYAHDFGAELFNVPERALRRVQMQQTQRSCRVIAPGLYYRWISLSLMRIVLCGFDFFLNDAPVQRPSSYDSASDENIEYNLYEQQTNPHAREKGMFINFLNCDHEREGIYSSSLVNSFAIFSAPSLICSRVSSADSSASSTFCTTNDARMFALTLISSSFLSFKVRFLRIDANLDKYRSDRHIMSRLRVYEPSYLLLEVFFRAVCNLVHNLQVVLSSLASSLSEGGCLLNDHALLVRDGSNEFSSKCVKFRDTASLRTIEFGPRVLPGDLDKLTSSLRPPPTARLVPHFSLRKLTKASSERSPS